MGQKLKEMRKWGGSVGKARERAQMLERYPTRRCTRSLYRLLRRTKTAGEARVITDQLRVRAVSGRDRWAPSAFAQVVPLIGPRGGVDVKGLRDLGPLRDSGRVVVLRDGVVKVDSRNPDYHYSDSRKVRSGI